MESFFDHAMATGRFALASGEALGANQADSIAAKVEGPRLDNKAQGRGFIGMSDSHRDIWLRNYLAKNYYM